MGHVRDRYDADLRLAGRAESTRTKYLRCATAFVKHFMRSPELLGEEHVREYLLLLMGRVADGSLAMGTYLPTLGAIKFLYRVTLRRPEVVASIPWPHERRRRIDVLTRAEVAEILAAAPTPYWRTFFTVAYAAGLRRMEVAALRTFDIDGKTGLLRVTAGKGGKNRVVKLDPRLLLSLRAHWREQALSGPWLFPAARRGGGWAEQPVRLGLASDRFRETVRAVSLGRRVTLHSLRSAYATHLLEEGVDLFALQRLMGHETLQTTQGYVEVRTDALLKAPTLLDKLPRP